MITTGYKIRDNMKHKTNIIIFALMLLSISASAQIQFTAGLNYESGVPSGAPSSTGSRIRVDLAPGRAYIWNQAGSNWRVLAQGIDIVAGCSAPLYTPGYGQSLFAVNGCASPELYYYTGAAWVQINAGGGGGSTDALRLKFIVVNKSGSTINKGEVVYVSGAQGNRVAVKKALASVDSLSANTLGVMDETVANNAEGYCVAEGLISGINTSAFTEGAALYLSPTTAGGITQTKTTAPDHLVLVGYCVKSNAGSGEISVHIQNGYELGELHDVYVPSPTNGQVLTYNTTNTRWEAATVADQSATNEGTIGVSAGNSTTSVITSNTSGANGVTVSAGTGISLSETTSTNGGTITVTNSAPDQTVSIANGGGIAVTGSYPSFTLTATDQSITNEIQRLDTFSLSAQTLSASLLNDGVAASSVTLPIVDVVAGTNVTVTKSNGVATVSATGGGGLSGVTGYVSQFNSSTTIDTTGLFWNGRLGINTESPSARLDIVGEGITSGTNAIEINNSARELFKISNNGAITVGKNDVTTTQNTASIASAGTDANIGIAIVPKGTGAITADIPDGTATGGNSRGNHAVDLQMQRDNAILVASALYSGVLSGFSNRATVSYSVVLGGQENNAGGLHASIIGGITNEATGIRSTILGGITNTATAEISTAAGGNSRAYLYGQNSYQSGGFSSSRSGDAQTSQIRYRRSITGTAATELYLDGASTRGVINLPVGATNGRLWNAIVQLSAICTTAGGTVTVGESFIGTYNLGIKRISNTTSLVGTVQNMITAQADTNMSSSVVTITADVTNESLKIEFTPPTGANASTVIRVVATVYLTEVGY